MWWMIGIILYLVTGLFFNTRGLKLYTRILLHVFWLPALILVFIIVRSNGFKI